MLETDLIIDCVAKPLLAPPFLRESKLPRDLMSASPPARKYNITDFASLSCSDLTLGVLFAFHKLEAVKSPSLVVDSEKLPAR